MTIARADALSPAVLPPSVQDPEVPALSDEFAGPTHTEANPLIIGGVAIPTLAVMALAGATYLGLRAATGGTEQAARDFESIKTGVQMLKDKVSVMMQEKTELTPEEVEKATAELAKLERWQNDPKSDDIPESARSSRGKGAEAFWDYVEGQIARIKKTLESL